ncbi:MAG: cytochrome b [Sphingomonadales bacterium]|nr:cytochrome b [Sphingomonadales bacterium]MBD3773986.1 cytochrome b [Paracoccaceae bacterium]
MQTTRYSAGAMILHWTIAILVIVNWRLAAGAEHLEGAAKGALMGPHKAIGMSILLLTLARIAWRLTHKTPPLSAKLAGWEVMLAKAVHGIFYLLLLGLPLGGWLASSMFGAGIDFFGLFTIPALPVGANKDLGGTLFDAHKVGGTVMLYLIVLHVLGALKHTVVDKDGNIFRMLPFGTPKA